MGNWMVDIRGSYQKLQLPDKCVSVLDTACSKLALSQTATPSQIEDCQRRITRTEVQIDALKREGAGKETSASD